MVITVLMMNGQKIKACLIKLAATFSTDRAMNLQGFRPVVGVIVNLAAHPLKNYSSLVGARKGNCPWAS